ncbi:hypothetical protein D3C81_1234220 [compost metagenome]
MLGRADLLIMRGVPDALTQQQQARLIGLGQQGAHFFQPWAKTQGLLFIQLPPLATHRA